MYNWTLPLWYAGLDPAKINLGLAYYGRGYTLDDPSCHHVGCKWSSVSRAGPCTNIDGVMSLQEINNLITELGIEPTLLEDDMMKQLTWGNQWIGYDDMETIAMKKAWASQHCHGGTMVWSIDLFSGPGSGEVPDGKGDASVNSDLRGGRAGLPVVYVDPSIWTESAPVIQCKPPCSFVLPPLLLESSTTISFPLLTTSLEVAWIESGTLKLSTQTKTLTIPPVVTDRIEFWGYPVYGSGGDELETAFRVTSSIRPPPFTITNDLSRSSSGQVFGPPVTRTITPPPFPYTGPIDTTIPTSSPSGTESTSPTSKASSTAPAVLIPPLVTFKAGPPGPACTKGCGKSCLLFCDRLCLFLVRLPRWRTGLSRSPEPTSKCASESQP